MEVAVRLTEDDDMPASLLLSGYLALLSNARVSASIVVRCSERSGIDLPDTARTNEDPDPPRGQAYGPFGPQVSSYPPLAESIALKGLSQLLAALFTSRSAKPQANCLGPGTDCTENPIDRAEELRAARSRTFTHMLRPNCTMRAF
eukprot:3193823-Rhodomonas_salina.1